MARRRLRNLVVEHPVSESVGPWFDSGWLLDQYEMDSRRTIRSGRQTTNMERRS